jgi:hypothetical protein
MQIRGDESAARANFVRGLEEIRQQYRYHSSSGCRANAVVGILKGCAQFWFDPEPLGCHLQWIRRRFAGSIVVMHRNCVKPSVQLVGNQVMLGSVMRRWGCDGPLNKAGYVQWQKPK